ncbi:unnamed protein product [Pleuronectes platessa]|uniref:Uncharacterized protein n=1 Tax=Pleuronectes platessa TaxID=8262 RepID=A0A9N7TT10_PLEPL|nr:unnamed protein product [Pleuronectes platessa]
MKSHHWLKCTIPVSQMSPPSSGHQDPTPDTFTSSLHLMRLHCLQETELLWSRPLRDPSRAPGRFEVSALRDGPEVGSQQRGGPAQSPETLLWDLII